jgi:hypothetical protein
MKVEKDGMTDMVGFPLAETDKIMDAMEQAEKVGDLEALKWCARFLRWLWDEGDVIGSDAYLRAERLFNKMWGSLLKSDPPPESIAGIINRGDVPEEVTSGKAENALDTLKDFLEYNLGGKTFKTVSASLDALREAVKNTEAVQ